MNKKTVSPKEGYDMHTHIRHIAMTILMCLFATSVHAAQISVEPVYQEVFQGGNVTINITVYPEENEVYGASYTLRFNNMLLYATSQAKGPFLTQDGASSNIYKDEIDNTIGEIIYAETRSATAGVTDPGVLTTITFQAIGEGGVGSLNMSDLDGELLYSLSGSILTIVNNGIVKVNINETPGFVECDSCNHCRYDCNTASQITAVGHNATHLITIDIGDILHGNVAGERFK